MYATWPLQEFVKMQFPPDWCNFYRIRILAFGFSWQLVQPLWNCFELRAYHLSCPKRSEKCQYLAHASATLYSAMTSRRRIQNGLGPRAGILIRGQILGCPGLGLLTSYSTHGLDSALKSMRGKCCVSAAPASTSHGAGRCTATAHLCLSICAGCQWSFQKNSTNRDIAGIVWYMVVYCRICLGSRLQLIGLFLV